MLWIYEKYKDEHHVKHTELDVLNSLPSSREKSRDSSRPQPSNLRNINTKKGIINHTSMIIMRQEILNIRKCKRKQELKEINNRIEKRMNLLKSSKSPNSFILYRKYVLDRINTNSNSSANLRDISKMVAQMWEQENL
ncbi:hypothetical protein GLOIN_2v1554121 [Rhizophagus clarus]|uniref:HMG box domain-containing protein n=1 Tax=Rhizophagus clarus TaxID=94130 RepID=A0A8H3R2T4_9GLOM|nr:hypothetical protein GLOIN_2v1554121 [Rhizophagus clarus]